MKSKHLSLALASLALAAMPAHAATTLYSDDFSGNVADDLNGTAPDTRITQDGASATATWTADTVWKANGTTASVNSTSADQSAFLAFTPVTGKIYTLSTTLTGRPGGGDTGSAGWAALGFAAAATTSGSFFASPNNTSPWMLYRKGGGVTSYEGAGATGATTHTTQTGEQTMTIVLNTQGTQWTADWYISGAGASPLRATHTFTTNPTITHIGIGRENGVSTDFSSFSLTVIPEPSAAMLGGLGALLLLRRRRN